MVSEALGTRRELIGNKLVDPYINEYQNNRRTDVHHRHSGVLISQLEWPGYAANVVMPWPW